MSQILTRIADAREQFDRQSYGFRPARILVLGNLEIEQLKAQMLHTMVSGLGLVKPDDLNQFSALKKVTEQVPDRFNDLEIIEAKQESRLDIYG